ncbi:MAG: hypothetical protein GX896_00925 [Clostridiales bacterium]|nr:hypothetical protein [Clostridiales bacterium]
MNPFISMILGMAVSYGTSSGLTKLDNKFNISGLNPPKVNPKLIETKNIINEVEMGEITLENNFQKGNYGEMKMDCYFDELGYERISLDQVTDLNASMQKGIDGVYYNPNGKPPYIIAEAKYGTSTLGNTLDGKQMSNSWITGSNRLENAVGKTMADNI